MCVCDCMALVITFRVAMLTVYEIFITFITHKPLAIRTAATLAAVSVDYYRREKWVPVGGPSLGTPYRSLSYARDAHT